MAVTYQRKTVYLEPGSYAGSRTVTIKAEGPLSFLFGHKRCLGKMCSHNSIRKAMPAPADIGFLPKRVCELLLTSLPRRCLCGLPLFSAMKKARSAATTRSSLGLVYEDVHSIATCAQTWMECLPAESKQTLQM